MSQEDKSLPQTPSSEAPVEAVAETAPAPSIPGPPPIADLLDLGIEEEIQKEDQDRLKGIVRRFPLSPSKFGSCSRQLAIDLAEFVGSGVFPLELIDARAKRRFARGYDIEYSMMKQLKKYIPIDQGFGQQYLNMAPTPDGKYIIGGSLDTLFITEEPMIVDIKSKATYWSSYRSDKFEEEFSQIGSMPGVIQFGERAYYIENIEEFYELYPRDNFISRYFLQLNAYGACDWAASFKSNLFPDVTGIKAVALLFENKNNHFMAEIRWKPSRKLYEETLERMQAIYKWVVIDKKDPAKHKAEFTLGSTMCRLCPRKAACWGDSRHPYTGPKKQWPIDSDKAPNNEGLEETYQAYKKALNAKIDHDNLEKELLAKVVATEEQKIRFSDGEVYELKYLKSPTPHYELRRSK